MMSAGSTAAALYLLALAVLNINCFVVNEITPWLPTSIPFHHLPQNKLLFTTLCHSKFHASMKCKFKANCNVFCSDTNGEFSFYRIRAEAFLPQIGDFKNCWTINPRKNIILEPGTVLSSSPNYRANRTLDNLKDGIYYNTLDDSVHLRGPGLVYILIDFGQKILLKKINVYPSTYGSQEHRLSNVLITTGTSLMNSSFSHFSEIGFIKTPPEIQGSFFSINLINPISARYIALQKYNIDLQVGHIQVYLWS